MLDMLAQGTAVLAPEKILEKLDELRQAGLEMESDEPQTPLCQADFDRIHGRAGKMD